ncbi:MAG: alpha/beta fold hydrolase, partial [Gemmatimonadota bacterium]|nr:alpha/beta fold hydrolase [Gemmatimonadota bacterium]
MPGLIKSISTGIISLAVIVLAIFVIVRLLENRITFYPQRILDYSPEDFGLSYEDVFLEPVKSEHIHGWFFAPPGDDKAAPVIVIFHGNGGNISHRLEWIAPFVRRGAGVLLFDYRGYGRSSGSPGEREFEEDALAVWEFLV